MTSGSSSNGAYRRNVSTVRALNIGTAEEQMGHWELNQWQRQESWLTGPGLDFLSGDE